MSRFHGTIGFVQTIEKSPGVFRELTTEYERYGDVIKESWNTGKTEGTNYDYTISNRISVVASKEMFEDVAHAAWVEYMGVKWKISNTDITNPPRMIFTLGGVYNGKK